MKLRTFSILILIGLLGCGGGDDQQIYDTDANPALFPQPAILLLQDLEANRLIGAQAITDRFGELYTEHSELLDREDWKGVVDRLGLRFGRMADSLTDLGFDSYTLAAEYYQLGSFARPQDTNLATRAKLFTRWPAALDSRFVDLTPLTESTPAGDEGWLAITRFFVLGDTLYYRFFQTELLATVRDKLDLGDIDRFSTTDRALLAAAGLIERPALEPLAEFDGYPVKLVACDVRRFDSITYRAELFFQVDHPIETDLQARFHLEFDKKERLTVYFTSLPPVAQWSKRPLLGGGAFYEARETPARLWVSLYDLAADEYVPFGTEDELFYELDKTDLTSP